MGLGVLLWLAERTATFRREIRGIGWCDSQAIGLLLRYVRTRTTYVFVWYRLGLGLLLLILLAAGVLAPLP